VLEPLEPQPESFREIARMNPEEPNVLRKPEIGQFPDDAERLGRILLGRGRKVTGRQQIFAVDVHHGLVPHGQEIAGVFCLELVRIDDHVVGTVFHGQRIGLRRGRAQGKEEITALVVAQAPQVNDEIHHVLAADVADVHEFLSLAHPDHRQVQGRHQVVPDLVADMVFDCPGLLVLQDQAHGDAVPVHRDHEIGAGGGGIGIVAEHGRLAVFHQDDLRAVHFLAQHGRQLHGLGFGHAVENLPPGCGQLGVAVAERQDRADRVEDRGTPDLPGLFGMRRILRVQFPPPRA